LTALRIGGTNQLAGLVSKIFPQELIITCTYIVKGTDLTLFITQTSNLSHQEAFFLLNDDFYEKKHQKQLFLI